LKGCPAETGFVLGFSGQLAWAAVALPSLMDLVILNRFDVLASLY